MPFRLLTPSRKTQLGSKRGHTCREQGRGCGSAPPPKNQHVIVLLNKEERECRRYADNVTTLKPIEPMAIRRLGGGRIKAKSQAVLGSNGIHTIELRTVYREYKTQVYSNTVKVSLDIIRLQ